MKEKKLKIKIVCGFRADQEYTVDCEQAHVAYYLFINKAHRFVFSNGIAIEGADIKRIVPDYNATFGFMPSYVMTPHDWADVYESEENSKAYKALQDRMTLAKDLAKQIPPGEQGKAMLQAPLKEHAKAFRSKSLTSGLADQMRLK